MEENGRTKREKDLHVSAYLNRNFVRKDHLFGFIRVELEPVGR